MNILHTIFYLLPYVFAFLIILYIYDLITEKKQGHNFNKSLVIIICTLSAVLGLYYLPSKNVLSKYYFTDILIKTGSSLTGVNVKDRAEIAKIVNVINEHSFIRSAVRTIELSDIGDDKLIMFLMYDFKRKKFIQIYSRIENKDALLIINGQVYNSMNKQKFNQDIVKLFNELHIKN